MISAPWALSSAADREAFCVSHALNQTLVAPTFRATLGSRTGDLQLQVPGVEGSQIGDPRAMFERDYSERSFYGPNAPHETNQVTPVNRANSRALFYLLHGFDMNKGAWRVSNTPSGQRLMQYDLEGAFNLSSWDPLVGGDNHRVEGLARTPPPS